MDGRSLWYKDAVIYEVHVRAFRDSNADGVGDFRGLIDKLDYIADLGVTAIWVLPFYPSPLRDDGYDIAEYRGVHPSYGTLRDFRAFLRAAHARGLRVITELVLNHTSDQHPWFQRARFAAPGSSWRDFYVWSDSPDRYRDARVIFKDFEPSNWAFDPGAGAYYWHRFYGHQPDLNFESPEVRRAIFDVVDFWLETGVDGLRLDAVPYLFEREGTNCENLPETHALLQELRAHVDERFGDRMLLAEANQWPEDAIAYFGDGDEGHMAFHFPLMPRMFMANRMEDRFPIVDILDQTPPIPETCQWALFLRNHDELTLEMVTDEERDYMYRVYARDVEARINLGIRRRLAPLLSNNRSLIEMMNGLLFSLPGTPVIYYGDEIGMGDNIYLGDRNGVRTPMQWSADRNAGFSDGNPQRLYLPVIIDPEYHASAVNVEAQQNNPDSLLWWMKRLITIRRRYAAFGRGSLEMLFPENRKVIAYLRHLGDEHVLVVANLSRHAQYAELDLSAYAELQPIEMFGGTEFPPIGELPYLLTLGPNAFYWFALEPRRVPEVQIEEPAVPMIEVSGGWDGVFAGQARVSLERALPAFVRRRRWFGGKARRIRAIHVTDAIALPDPPGSEARDVPRGYLTFLQVEYAEGDPQTYLLPIVAGSWHEETTEHFPHPVLARVRTPDGDHLLFDGMFDRDLSRTVLELVRRRRQLSTGRGRLVASRTPELRRLLAAADDGSLEPSVLHAEQTNTSVVYGDRAILKLFRRPDEGVNPDLEVGRFLTDRARFPHVAPVAGALEYRRGAGEPMTLGVLHGFVPNEGDAWSYTLDALGRYMEVALARRAQGEEAPIPSQTAFLDLAEAEPPPLVEETVGPYLRSAELLGRRTAELHLALASDRRDPAFAPEPLGTFSRRALYQSMRTEAARTMQLVRRKVPEHPELADVIELEPAIRNRLRELLGVRMTGMRIRCHGDYHLGQVLYTGKDFVVIDFEGRPVNSLSERRLKRPPLRDVVGMLASFRYAGNAALFGQAAGIVRPEDPEALAPWIRAWYLWVAGEFLHGYVDAVGDAPFHPSDRDELELLLEVFLLEKAIYDLAYELGNRPEWLRIPVEVILDLVEPAAA